VVTAGGVTAGGGLNSVLAGLCLALVPAGNALSFSGGGKSLGLPASYFAVAALMLNMCLGALMRGVDHSDLLRSLKLAVALLGLLSVPVFLSGLESLQVVAFVSFAVGTLGGLLVGVAWAHQPDRLNAVDAGAAFFVLATVVQLGRLFTSAQDLSTFHRAAVLDWGGSNFIAGVLVVVSIALAARISRTRTSPLLMCIPGLGLVAAFATLSRGAIVAAACGLLVLLWSERRSPLMRAILRTAGILVVLLAVPAIRYVAAARSVGGYNPETNVSGRLSLLRLAWSSFEQSPVTGTGWLTLRTAPGVAYHYSYAHNLFVSFLQIAGVFGALFLLLLLREAWRAVRADPAMGAAIVAALAMSMTEPFFEGTAGAMVAWALIAYSRSAQTTDPDAKRASAEVQRSKVAKPAS